MEGVVHGYICSKRRERKVDNLFEKLVSYIGGALRVSMTQAVE